ncbi:MAG: 16S rRNA (uracil(1498)-N(3))-methyltransferase [Muribaculaceae bacterium]|nr:16S rRNA (uracil(1498)-N(3))-methyltransferase [Muribaculaceae bacterium]
MIQFYAPEIESTGFLPEAESGHCVRVLRMKEGDTLYVTDGRGSRFGCRIVEAHPRHVGVEIVSTEKIEPVIGVSIVLAVAPSKNMDRMEWLVEKAVEIGVTRIVMLRCARSERKVVKPERLMRIAVSAMNQSLKGCIPEVTEMTDFQDFISSLPAGQAFMGYCAPDVERREFVAECKPDTDTTILIGPEGDFTEAEVARAMDAGVTPVTFGNARLRTETAALFGVQGVHIINQLACSGKLK